VSLPDPPRCVYAATKRSTFLSPHSSSWREDVAERIPVALHRNGLASCVERIVGHTPILPDAPERTRRADEIDAWLEIHPARRNCFLILDDADMTPELRARHIQTDPAIGLTLAHVRVAIGILKR